MTYSDTVAAGDPSSKVLDEGFADCLGKGFKFEPYHGATLFKQGMQCGNLDMANLAIYDFYNQVPETSILGIGYLFRDVDHMRAVFRSHVLDGLVAQMEKKTDVKVLAWPYIGARHVNIRGDWKVMSPADLAGIKLRMLGYKG